MYTILKNRNKQIGKEAIDFTIDLIQTPSPSLGEARIAVLVQNKMKEIGFDKILSDEFGNITGIIFGRESGPTVLLNTHMDTAAITDQKKWLNPPYKPIKKNGRIYGLGASDCKSGLSAQIHVAALLKNSLLPLQGNLIVTATVCEEKGGSPGVRHLMDYTLPSLGLTPDFAILGEPTNLSLYRGHDGYASFEITVQGKDENQVNHAAKAIFGRLQDRNSGHFITNSENTKPETPYFENNCGIQRGIVGYSLRLHKCDSVSSTIKRIRDEATHAANSSSSVAVNVLLAREKTHLYTKHTTILKKRIAAWSIDPYHPLMEQSRQALAAAGSSVSCGKWQLPRLGMGTAGGTLVQQYGIPTIGYGPGAEENCHIANEFVETVNIPQAVYGTATIVHRLIGIPVCGWTSDDI